MSDDERQQRIIAEYAKAKKAQKTCLILFAAGMFGTGILAVSHTLTPRLTPWQIGLGIVSLCAVLAGIGVGLLKPARCPTCKSYSRELDPKYCPHCGQRLKPL